MSQEQQQKTTILGMRTVLFLQMEEMTRIW